MPHNDFPSLRQLRAFEAVARLQSMSGAARDINLSQPGVTQSIEALERQLQVRLFERQRSGCYATALGTILLPRVQAFFDHVRSALEELTGGYQSPGRQILEMTNKVTKPQFRSLLAVYESDPSRPPHGAWEFRSRRFIAPPGSWNASCGAVYTNEPQGASPRMREAPSLRGGFKSRSAKFNTGSRS